MKWDLIGEGDIYMSLYPVETGVRTREPGAADEDSDTSQGAVA